MVVGGAVGESLGGRRRAVCDGLDVEVERLAAAAVPRKGDLLAVGRERGVALYAGKARDRHGRQTTELRVETRTAMNAPTPTRAAATRPAAIHRRRFFWR